MVVLFPVFFSKPIFTLQSKEYWSAFNGAIVRQTDFFLSLLQPERSLNPCMLVTPALYVSMHTWRSLLQKSLITVLPSTHPLPLQQNSSTSLYIPISMWWIFFLIPLFSWIFFLKWKPPLYTLSHAEPTQQNHVHGYSFGQKLQIAWLSVQCKVKMHAWIYLCQTRLRQILWKYY